ncbi:MAG TPA: ATP-binding protein [Nocardioides sp.]|nr:ATP-binding protein [Nocardioides sp.]
MSALPRPALAGPSRALNDALHDLHHRAGWPSLRVLARETGVSHTTVSKTFSQPALPSWGTVELLVEAMGGDATEFRDLWLAASSPADDGGRPVSRIAGRRAELEAVRRHLEAGAGLLLVTGEAGIGKTTLVHTAAQRSDVVVAWGLCLPLSTEIPLLPVADCLRSAYEADPPRFVHVVDTCPPFVAPAVSLLVPELGATTGAPVRSDDRVLLFSAIASVLKAMAAVGRTVLVVEDLHWSDSATRDLLEHLVGRRSPVPVVGTWRTGDPETPVAAQEWFERVQRLRETTTLPLGTLTRDETAHQLALMGADAAHVDVIHARSQGQPLFTEQLAAHLDDETGLPGILADLLDRRLVGLSGRAWSVVRALGLAERPLPTVPLAAVCGLAEEDLTSVLRELRARRLLRTGTSEHAELEHPLLAEAVRRRLVAGEGLPVHRALADALSALPDPEAAEVAEHWRRAGEPAEELGWRVSAARRAAARFDRRQEAEHWLRVIEIWPATGSHPDTPVTRAEAYVAAMDALRGSFRFNEAAALSEAADECLAEADEGDRADLLFRRSIYRGDPEGFESGLALLDEALAIHDRLPVREGKVRALDRKQLLLFAMGRSAESRAVADDEVSAARELGNPVLLRDALMRVAWHTGIAGDVERGMALLTSAAADAGARDDPLGDVRLGVYATDMLLTTGAPPDAVVAAGRDALAVAREHDFDNPQVMLVRVNVAFSLLRGGRVAEAEQVVATPSDAPWDADRWPLHAARVVIDSRLGLAEAATSRLAQIWAEPSTSAPRDLEFLMWATDVALWTGAAQPTLDHVLGQLDDVAATAPVRLVAPVLVAAARLAAHRGAPQHVDLLQGLAERCGLVVPADGDDPHLAAQRASFLADTAALAGSGSVAAWAAAAAAWDRLSAAHDASYCRWLAARCALRDGEGTVAQRLLRRAAADAREHVPLARAIATTASGTTASGTRT